MEGRRRELRGGLENPPHILIEDSETEAEGEAIGARSLVGVLAQGLAEERSLLPVRVQVVALLSRLPLRALHRFVGERVERIETRRRRLVVRLELPVGTRRLDRGVELPVDDVVDLRVVE